MPANNPIIFNSALAGAASGISSRWLTSAASSTYPTLQTAIVAFATAFDLAIAPTTVTDAEGRLVESIANSYWKDRIQTKTLSSDYSLDVIPLVGLYNQLRTSLEAEAAGALAAPVGIWLVTEDTGGQQQAIAGLYGSRLAAGGDTLDPDVLIDCSTFPDTYPWFIAVADNGDLIIPAGSGVGASDKGIYRILARDLITGLSQEVFQWRIPNIGNNPHANSVVFMRSSLSGFDARDLVICCANFGTINALGNGFFRMGSAFLGTQFQDFVEVVKYEGPLVPEESSYSGPIIGPDGRIWVCAYASDAIQGWDLSGIPTTISGVTMTSADEIRIAGANWPGPIGVAFDASGNLWVSSYDSNTLRRVDAVNIANGNLVPDAIISGAALDGPAEIVFDWDGNLYVANYNRAELLRYAAADLAVTGAPAPDATWTLNGALSNVNAIRMGIGFGPLR